MKKLVMVLMASMMVAFAAHAERSFNLENAALNLGDLQQTRGTSAFETFQVVRTQATPEEVVVFFNFKERTSVCAERSYRQICDPGYYDVVCWSDRYGRQICNRVWRPGYCREESFCVRYEDVYVTNPKQIRFDFDKALPLASDESEIFEVTLSQKGAASGKIEATGRALQSAAAYEVDYRTFLTKDKLIFKVKN
jgi:hypothetical protein